MVWRRIDWDALALFCRNSRRTPLTLILAFGCLLGASGPSFGLDLRALWPFGRKSAEVEIPDPVAYEVDFQVVGGNKKLARTLRKTSVLVSRRKTPVSGLGGLLTRARQDIPRLVAVLYDNALYAGVVTITIDGRPLDSYSPFDPVPPQPVQVSVVVDTGEPFLLGRVNATPLPPGLTLSDLDLDPGEPAYAYKILAAENTIANGWRENGHPLARVSERDTVADHATRTLDVSLRVAPGPFADFGRVEVVGTDRMNPGFVERRAGIDGGPYTTRVTRRAEKRLRDLGVFESVRVVTAERLASDGTIPITIEVSERPRHVVGASATYSSTEGAGLEAFWMNRNLWGGAEQLRFSAAVSRLGEAEFDDPDFRVAAQFVKPGLIGPMTDFTLQTEVYRETTDAYRVTAAQVETGLTQVISDTLTGGLSFELERSEIEATTTSNHLLATLSGTLVWDKRNDPFDPTRGFQANLEVAPAYDLLEKQAFATFRAGGSIYHAIDQAQRFIVAGRVEVGVVTVDDINDVAPNRRLYAGGGGSVRGYAYQNIGPRDAMGELIGGRSLFELSGELRYRATDSIEAVAFVDGGNAYSSITPDITDLKIGVGAGVRYFTPVGPVRIDLAIPLDRGPGDPSVALYAGFGQAF